MDIILQYQTGERIEAAELAHVPLKDLVELQKIVNDAVDLIARHLRAARADGWDIANGGILAAATDKQGMNTQLARAINDELARREKLGCKNG